MFSGKTMRTNLHSEKSFTMVSRGERIRTFDPLVPNQMEQSIPPTNSQGKRKTSKSVTSTVTLLSEILATQDSIRNAAKSVEKLIDSTPRSDHHTLGLLGPVLAELRSAQATIEQLEPQQHTA